MMKVYFSALLIFLFREIWCQITDEEYAKLPPVFHADDFDSCMLLGKEAFYCTINFQLRPIDQEKASTTWENIQKLGRISKNYHHDLLRHGICVSTTCPNVTRELKDISQFEDGLVKCYNKKYVKYGLYGEITYMHCQTNEKVRYDQYDISMIIFLTAYLIFVIFATLYGDFVGFKPKAEYEGSGNSLFSRILPCFSISRNFNRLKSMKESEDMKSLKAIQGIRFFNMVLVISCHHIMITLIGPISNTQFIETLTDQFENIFFASGTYAVQTFFLISSWLLTYHVLMMVENKKSIGVKNLLWIFVNRYIRLTPTLAVVLGLHATLMKYSPRGPFWDHIVGEDYRNCRKNGWTNLLYVNNYVDETNMCMQQTWYIASDTQLFILGLFILALVTKWKNKMRLILLISLIIGVAIPGVLAYINTSDILVRAYPEVIYRSYLENENWHLLYSSGHSNIGAYVIGVIFGYLYYTYRNVNLPTNKLHGILWYILSFGLGLAIIAISYPMYQNSYVPSRLESALYWSFGKNIFTLAIAIGIFGMTQKLGGLCRSICSWNPVVILGRLTYSAYLIHVFLLRVRAGSIRNPIYIDRYQFISGTIGDATMTYICAFLLCLLFEMPISALQKLWLPQNSRQEQKLLTKMDFPKIIIQKEEGV